MLISGLEKVGSVSGGNKSIPALELPLPEMHHFVVQVMSLFAVDCTQKMSLGRLRM